MPRPAAGTGAMPSIPAMVNFFLAPFADNLPLLAKPRTNERTLPELQLRACSVRYAIGRLRMFRIVMIVAAILASPGMAIPHESSSPPPPPKEDSTTRPQVVQTKGGLVLVDPKGMTLYYF